MRVLSANETRQSLPMHDAIDAMRSAFGPDVQIPLRQSVGNSLVMPGRVGDHVGMKVVSTVPGKPSGIVVVFDGEGVPVGIVDGPAITAIRTGAIAGLATDILAPSDASRFSMIGAGAMARDQIAAVLAVRDVDTITVWSRERTKACALAKEVGGTCADTPDEAVSGATIVTTATPSTRPLFNDSALGQHVHVNAIGAFTPEMVELPAAFVRDAYVVVDDIEAAAAEAGDLILANRTPDASMSELLTDPLPQHHGRTLFKSVGVASQDVAAAVTALNNALSEGIGIDV